MKRVNGPPTSILAALVIRKQPFPFVLMNGKQLGEEDLQVQLLLGASQKMDYGNHQLPYIVRATLLGDKPQVGRGPALENCTQALNDKGVAGFPLRFPTGTHRSVVHLKFTMTLKDSSFIESQMSNPFIILTNESQWSECFGTLIKRDAFKDSLSIPWPQLANTLQQHFLIATRQDIHLI